MWICPDNGGRVLIDHEHVFLLFAADEYDNFWRVFNNLISVRFQKKKENNHSPLKESYNKFPKIKNFSFENFATLTRNYKLIYIQSYR